MAPPTVLQCNSITLAGHGCANGRRDLLVESGRESVVACCRLERARVPCESRVVDVAFPNCVHQLR